ncbi:MotE family protein [Phenylobacterium sp.]|uniref:MotE family protein n=1 Tax=Phenylobacterium sp. TaxID=1871053 RepID=UPI00286DECE3|nr:MotE family protein [Phenylobacterium sp.]
MKNIPRILPLVGIAAAGVLAVNAMAGAKSLPDMFSGAKAFAEEAAKPLTGKAAADAAKAEAATVGAEGAAFGSALDASSLSLAPKPAPAVCAPTAAELAKEAGLSPAELQILQSLGSRRGQLDQREQDLDVQLALLAAAEAKLDAKVKTLTGLKGDMQTLLNQADGKEQGEVDRLVKVFEGMKAKDAAPRMVMLDDSVRLPIAGKMKERSLSAIIAAMPPAEAKRLTESLSRRFADARKVAANAESAASNAAANTAAPKQASIDPTAEPAPAPTAAPRKAAPKKVAARKPAPKAAPVQQAAATPAPAAAAPTVQPATPAAAAPPKAG